MKIKEISDENSAETFFGYNLSKMVKIWEHPRRTHTFRVLQTSRQLVSEMIYKKRIVI